MSEIAVLFCLIQNIAVNLNHDKLKRMNNKFIPLLSFFMTVSLLVFVAMQLYWLKEYYEALDQDFSNKVYAAVESSRKHIEDDEINTYFKKYGGFKKEVAQSKAPTQTIVQSVRDSAGIHNIVFSKSVLNKTSIPLTSKGDSLDVVKQYTDEGVLKINKNISSLSPELDLSLNSNQSKLQAFVKLNLKHLPIEKRIDAAKLDSILHRELNLKGIYASFEYGIVDKNGQNTKLYKINPKHLTEHNQYVFSLFSDAQFKTQYSLKLCFLNKNFSLFEGNFGMLLGTMLSLLIILSIYIVSINYMSKQKKISEIKTDFINNMSHEFKTPLATISVATDSLQNDYIATNPEKVKYYSALIKQENLRMKKQVENVLNMSKLERNEIKLFLKTTNMKQLLQDAVSSFRLIVEQRDGQILEDYAAENFFIKVDEFHVSNMVVNLLDNANKYSKDKPLIEVSTHNEPGFFVLSIADQGIGLASTNMEKIFDKFFREETGNIHNVKGQGLGLTYVKNMVDLHKATIEVDSQKGIGTKFSIKFPM
jgi:two-component system, OmpR family, phosphate regulon sensor histidine kinase PhoR